MNYFFFSTENKKLYNALILEKYSETKEVEMFIQNIAKKKRKGIYYILYQTILKLLHMLILNNERGLQNVRMFANKEFYGSIAFSLN